MAGGVRRSNAQEKGVANTAIASGVAGRGLYRKGVGDVSRAQAWAQLRVLQLKMGPTIAGGGRKQNGRPHVCS